MTLTSLKFFALLCASLACFYLLKKKQKYVLLATSLVFFAAASQGKELYMCAIMFLVCAVTYFGALLVQKCQGWKKTAVAVCSILILVANLVALKYLFNVGGLILSLLDINKDISFLRFAAPIGLSYFSLNAIGYLLDVYWQTYEAQKNPADIALFISYFPQIVSGPVLRLPEVKEQFNEARAPDYDNIVYGVRRMIFGYMKKLVVADRLAPIVQEIYAAPDERAGLALLFGVVCYAGQLYADFSGCMDIVLGASRLYGITLPENFDAPFFSRTLPEFWRRWHISLGNWFRDYVMYPILKTSAFQKLGQAAKKTFGKKYGKKIPTYLSTVILWALIGIWHGGTGYYFMASAVIPGVMLILSDLTQGFFEKLSAKFKINAQSVLWHIYQSLRTLCVMLVCWIFVCAQNVKDGFFVVRQIVSNARFSLVRENFAALKLSAKGTWPLITGLLIIFAADFLRDRKTPINEIVNRQKFIVRVALVYLELALLLLFGLVGQSSFIYFKF